LPRLDGGLSTKRLETSRVYFDEFLAVFPQILAERKQLVHGSDAVSSLDVLAGRFDQQGLLVFKQALSPVLISRVLEHLIDFGKKLERFPELARWDPRTPSAYRQGTGNHVWELEIDEQYVLAPLIPALVGSWVWPAVEMLCGSTDILIALPACVMRHVTDNRLTLGVHQDTTAVSDVIPHSFWIPLHDVVPELCSGLGFVVPRPDGALPCAPNTDIGEHYLLEHVNDTWLPSYSSGDVSLHHKFTPHFTTGFGTQTERFSVEIRCMAASSVAPEHLRNPSLYVTRGSEGQPQITEMRAMAATFKGHPFLHWLRAAGLPVIGEVERDGWIYEKYL
jgi:hypothetical protein